MSGDGRPPTFEAVFEAHIDWMVHTLRRLGVHEADLEDQAHETFLAVMRHLSSYDPGRPMRPWLFAFAYHVAGDYRKRAHRRYEQATDTADELPSSSSFEAELEARRRRDLLVRALERVEPERRAVLILHDLDGAAMPDIAATLEIPLNTGYSRLRLARAELKTAVRELRGDPEGGDA